MKGTSNQKMVKTDNRINVWVCVCAHVWQTPISVKIIITSLILVDGPFEMSSASTASEEPKTT